MRFTPTELDGLARVELELVDDERGSFARLHCEREFAAHGLPTRMVQTSLSRTRRQGTVRGMHFQWPPSREGKLVRCIRGRDLRRRDRPAAGIGHLRPALRA